ncbi:unnamed protein product [Leptidea sinapis]|uniref:Major facilitator superfamily (MFS) profile domain-containing protein n=1 Tax=Leptidea sinapis TaxID=189913 RepID=A0A5E4QH92_9NEOP|nr:unnamed protein product [Leptidea sinapis]
MESVYDRGLIEVGDNGKFQRYFDFKYNIIVVFLWSMAFMNIVLSLAIMPYTCKLPEKPQNVSDYEWKAKYLPTRKDVNGEMKFSSCLIYNDPDTTNATKECDSYNFDKTWYEWTIPSEKNWVCDKEINVANIYAYSKISEAFGSVFFGWFGDVYGRRPTYILSLTMIVIGRIVSLVAGSSFIVFVIGCVIASLPSWSVPQTVSVISMEMSSSSRRTVTTTLRYTAFSIGLAIMPFLYWWLRDWKTFIIVTTAPLLPFALLSWKITESPRWMFVEGNAKKCIKTMKKIAQTNDFKLSHDIEKEMLSTTYSNNAQWFGPFALFSSKRLALNTILLLLLWIFVSIMYAVMLLSVGETSQSNPFLEFSIQSIVEIPSNFLGAWLCDRIGRRRSAVSSLIVIALMWSVVTYREMTSLEWLRLPWIGSALIAIGRLTISITFFAINLMNLEIYPTCLRQSGLSLGNVVSSVSAAISPYILFLGRRVDSRLPGLILTSVSIFSVFTSMFLPETLNAKLPETIEDAQKFGEKIKKEYSKVSTKDLENISSTKEMPKRQQCT